MTEVILTSKVIVTDDYVKYLRYFPLRPEQRVIQLWHACGAFKKFGQRGTNMSLPEDRATHAQYNLVCVSGENLPSIYADAFDVNYNKVKALRCPRTDEYFNKRNKKSQEPLLLAFFYFISLIALINFSSLIFVCVILTSKTSLPLININSKSLLP